MRKFVAAAALAALALISAPASAQSAPGWTYAYTDGNAVATRRDEDGDVIATITCRPPDGVMVLSTQFRGAGGARSAQVRIGQGLALNVPATTQGRGGRARIVINLPQRPPILAAVQRDDELTVTVGDNTQGLGRGSGAQMEAVAYACWSTGA